MELDRKLLVYMNEFYLIKDKYEELQKVMTLKDSLYVSRNRRFT